MKRALLLLVAACGASSAPPAPSNTAVQPEAEPSPPSLDELRALLAPHAGEAFAPSALERACPADQTVGEYVAMLVDNGAPKPDGDLHRLTGGCSAQFPGEPAPIEPPADPAYWSCRIDAFTSDPPGESPWHYELRVRVRKADRAPDLALAACPGTP